MAAIDKVNSGILGILGPEVNKIVWAAYDLVKDDSYTFKITLLKIPIQKTVSISNFESLVTILIGERIPSTVI